LKIFMQISAFLLAGALLSGCATSGKINSVSIGMTKNQVVEAMGAPDTVSSHSGSEYLSYFLCYSNCAALIVENRGRDWYYVRLINGTVESFGKKGDFDSAKVPTTRIERIDTIKQNIRIQDSRASEGGDKYAELTRLKTLLDSGTITKDEFESQKKRILEKNN
jgi:Short C-terminal domain